MRIKVSKNNFNIRISYFIRKKPIIPVLFQNNILIYIKVRSQTEYDTS